MRQSRGVEGDAVSSVLNAGSGFLASDAMPETLIQVLKILAENFVSETLAAADLIDR